MPDDRSPTNSGQSNPTERLNAAIDRMMSGGPTPVLNDPDLRDLLALATRLRDELPEDLPDPAFRLDLKEQLTASRPVAVPRSRAASQPRFPWVAAISAIAAVMLAAISVGTLAIWLTDDSGDPGPTNIANSSFDQMTATTIGFATATAAAFTEPTVLPTTLDEQGAEPTPQPAETPAQPVDETPSAIPPRATTADATATTDVQPTPTSEPEGPALAAVPPVDGQTIEHGPTTAADGSGGPPSAEITYVLATDLPNLGAEAMIYRLAPPQEDPETFVTTVAASLGLEGEIVVDAPKGQAVYHLFDDEGSFHWTPDTGAFTLATSDDEDGGAMPADQLIDSVRNWLDEIGYPVERLESNVHAEQIGDNTWRLDARYAAMPDIGLGHPLGVTVYVNPDGSVAEVTGYWLELRQADLASLRPADDIWEDVKQGHGYWTGGGIVTEGGEFRADSMAVTYVLTRDQSGELVLQPVVQTTGDFTTPDGLSSARVSCFVQAAATTSEDEP